MTAVRKIQIEEEPVFAAPVARMPATKLYVVTNNAPAETAAPEATGNALKNIVLFFAAPFIGLAYIVALPVVGLAVLAVLTGRVAAKFEAVRTAGLALKTVALAVAAPFVRIGLCRVLPGDRIGHADLDGWPGDRRCRTLNEIDQ